MEYTSSPDIRTLTNHLHSQRRQILHSQSCQSCQKSSGSSESSPTLMYFPLILMFGIWAILNDSTLLPSAHLFSKLRQSSMCRCFKLVRCRMGRYISFLQQLRDSFWREERWLNQSGKASIPLKFPIRSTSRAVKSWISFGRGLSVGLSTNISFEGRVRVSNGRITQNWESIQLFNKPTVFQSL